MITDPTPEHPLTQKLEREVEIIRIEQRMTPTCGEESMLPQAQRQREDDLEAACTLGE